MSHIAGIYRSLMSDPATNYGFGDHWRPVWPDIRAKQPKNLLDVGCGRGNLVMTCIASGITAVGCDVAPVEPWMAQAQLPILPFADAAFDVVCSFDVLEHVAEVDIPASIAELKRVCRRHLIVSIAECSDKRHVPGIGPVELHLTRQPVAWWLERLGGQRMPVETKPWRHYIAVNV